MSLNKGQKLVRMLELMTRRGGSNRLDLMERFDLDARTMRRYLADLRDLGIPIIDEGRGEDRIISVEAHWRRTGVQLSLVEVLSLHFGRTLFNFLEGTSFASDLDDALERLEPAISRTHQNLCKQLDTKFLAVGEQSKDYRGEASEVIDEAITALVYNNPLEGRYRKASGVEGAYFLHPYTLATFRQGLYLFAKDVEANLVKTFALERFTDLSRRRGEHFEHPVGWRPDAHIAHAFGIISGTPQEVSISFSERVSAYIRERTWHPTQTFKTLPSGQLELRMHVAVTIELQTWIQGFGPDAIATGPEDLARRIGESLKRAAEHYQ